MCISASLLNAAPGMFHVMLWKRYHLENTSSLVSLIIVVVNMRYSFFLPFSDCLTEHNRATQMLLILMKTMDVDSLHVMTLQYEWCVHILDTQMHT